MQSPPKSASVQIKTCPSMSATSAPGCKQDGMNFGGSLEWTYKLTTGVALIRTEAMATARAMKLNLDGNCMIVGGLEDRRVTSVGSDNSRLLGGLLYVRRTEQTSVFRFLDSWGLGDASSQKDAAVDDT